MAPFNSDLGAANWTAKSRTHARTRPSGITPITHEIEAPEHTALGRAIFDADAESHVRSLIRGGVAYGTVDSIGLARVRALRDAHLEASVAQTRVA